MEWGQIIEKGEYLYERTRNGPVSLDGKNRITFTSKYFPSFSKKAPFSSRKTTESSDSEGQDAGTEGQALGTVVGQAFTSGAVALAASISCLVLLLATGKYMIK